MVNDRRTGTIVFVIAILGATGFLLLRPSVHSDRDHAAAGLFHAALGTYKDQVGHAPASLVDLEQILSEVARAECQIVGENAKYRVTLTWPSDGQVEFKVQCTVGRQGYAEVCRAYDFCEHSIDSAQPMCRGEPQ